MNPSSPSKTRAQADLRTSPPGVYAVLFVGVTASIGFFTLIVAVAFA